MSEKQFRITTNPKSNAVAFDEKQKKHYIGIDLEDLLNEQQATINKLEQENRQLRQFINKGRRLSVKELMENTNENELLKKKIRGLEKENKELQTELDSSKGGE